MVLSSKDDSCAKTEKIAKANNAAKAKAKNIQKVKSEFTSFRQVKNRGKRLHTPNQFLGFSATHSKKSPGKRKRVENFGNLEGGLGLQQIPGKSETENGVG